MSLVLHLSDRLSARGGADRHLVAILHQLRGRVATFLAVGRDDGSLPAGERPGLGPWRRLKGLDLSGLAPRGGEAAHARLAGLLAELRPRLVHVHNLMAPELIALAAAHGPALMTVQDHRLFCPGPGKVLPDGSPCRRPLGEACGACFRDADYGRRLLALTLRRLRAAAGLGCLLVLSRYMAGELEAAFAVQGLAAPPVEVLPPPVHGLPAGMAGEAGRGGHFLLAGRLVARKGVRELLAAHRRLAPPFPLVIAGDGPLAPEVAAAAARPGSGVDFAGWADRASLVRLLGGARAVVLPSLWAEPFGIAGLEALALGRPVVASRVGGVTDWLEDGVNGLLVPPGDVAALATALGRLAGDPALATRLGRNGAALVAERFAAGPLLARLEARYRSLAPC